MKEDSLNFLTLLFTSCTHTHLVLPTSGYNVHNWGRNKKGSENAANGLQRKAAQGPHVSQSPGSLSPVSIGVLLMVLALNRCIPSWFLWGRVLLGSFREDLCYQLLPFMWTAQPTISSPQLSTSSGQGSLPVLLVVAAAVWGQSGLSWGLPTITKTLLKDRSVPKPQLCLGRDA